MFFSWLLYRHGAKILIMHSNIQAMTHLEIYLSQVSLLLSANRMRASAEPRQAPR